MQDAYVLMEFESPYPCTRAVFVTGSKVCVAGYQDGTLRAFDLDKVLLWLNKNSLASPAKIL